MAEHHHQQIVLHVMDRDARNHIRDVFDDLENRLRIDGIGTVLTTSILELVENAVKANLKRAFFQKHGFDIHHPDQYRQGVRAFINAFRTIPPDEYRQALLDLDLIVSVEVDNNAQRLLIYVENSALLLLEEEKRIRRQLAAAMQAEALESFYLNFGDETEGSGMGLAMIVLLIRNLGFPPEHFRVFHRGERTIARLEFPMAADYVPLRTRWLQEKSGSDTDGPKSVDDA